MLASIAICTPFDADSIPTKIGYVAIGAILTFGIGLLYSLFTLEKNTIATNTTLQKENYTNITESLIFGIFMCLSLAIAFIFEIENPYWVPISCVAVMQGSSSKHTWIRGLQRIVGIRFNLIGFLHKSDTNFHHI